MRIELTTSSLPRKCSTPELQQLEKKSENSIYKLSSLNYFKKLISYTSFGLTIHPDCAQISLPVSKSEI